MPIIFYPHRRYLFKQCTAALLSLPFHLLVFGGIASSFKPMALIVLPLILLALALSVVAVVLSYYNLRYEITEDEIIVYSGVLNKSIKHVPFRTITNMEVKRGFWDRLFRLGTLEIQTAGSGTTQAEEKLVGLDDVQGAYEYVANVLRGFRSGISPTQTQAATPSADRENQSERELLIHILNELRAIRRELRQTSLSS